MSWMGIIITFALVDNAVLSRLLGVCPDVTQKGRIKGAVQIGLAMTVLLTIAAAAAGVLEDTIIGPLGLSYLRTPVFVLLVVGLAFLLQFLAVRVLPDFAPAPGFSFAEVGINSASLGVVLIVSRAGLSGAETAIAGAAAGAGYFLVTVLMNAIRERLEIEQVPRSLRGLPLHLISAGLLAYAFMAFDRAFLARILGS
jgi:Na+-translocating ferredoxin:NAD+ oxidoreductase subunit A